MSCQSKNTTLVVHMKHISCGPQIVVYFFVVVVVVVVVVLCLIISARPRCITICINEVPVWQREVPE